MNVVPLLVGMVRGLAYEEMDEVPLSVVAASAHDNPLTGTSTHGTPLAEGHYSEAYGGIDDCAQPSDEPGCIDTDSQPSPSRLGSLFRWRSSNVNDPLRTPLGPTTLHGVTSASADGEEAGGAAESFVRPFCWETWCSSLQRTDKTAQKNS